MNFEGKGDGGCNGGGHGETVVVGVKLDSPSTELLTWALVKVAQAGDRVIALHVFHNKDFPDQKGNSSLLSLVKAFDSVLAVYEGFCNLKQIDLKLKICRGTSVRKVLVQEARSVIATRVILGISRKRRTIRSSTSIAKYCAKKLPSSCWVLAANGGKVVFERAAKGSVALSERSKTGKHRGATKKLLDALHRTLSKNSLILLNGRNSKLLLTWGDDGGKNEVNLTGLRMADAIQSFPASGSCGIVDDALKVSIIQKCSVCGPNSLSLEMAYSPRQYRDKVTNDSLAVVPVKIVKAASNSFSLLLRELREMGHGCPLLRQAFLPGKKSSLKSRVREFAVAHLAMHPRYLTSLSNFRSDYKMINRDGFNLERTVGAIVPVGHIVSSKPDEFELKSLPKELESLREKYSSTCRLFQYKELQQATSDFSKENVIGKGGSSQVFKGCLSDGKELAVKILKPSEQALKEFTLEIEIITTLNHKNIASLFGFCFDDNKLLLVYDFLPRGSLEENLQGQALLSWDKRYKVALGVAEALDYLHNSSTRPVIHRDVKSSNILLGDDFSPQLSDFGLATWASTSSSFTCSDVAGTFGYLAPEYFMFGKVNDKIDVYAFGVVLLELLSGRKPINNGYPKGQESLVMWARQILQSGKFIQLLDPKLDDKYDNDQLDKIVLAASLCIRHSPRLRPQMNTILKLLKGDDEITKWATFQVSKSDDLEELDDESYPFPNIQTHLSLALLDVENDE